MQVLLQAIDFRVTDIRSIEKGYEVEKSEPWDEFEVEFPEQFAVLEKQQCQWVIHERNESIYVSGAFFFAEESIGIWEVIDTVTFIFDVIVRSDPLLPARAVAGSFCGRGHVENRILLRKQR